MNYENFETVRILYDSDKCTGRHCAEHNARRHVVKSMVKRTNKSFTVRVPCKGTNCQICEAFRE